MKVLIIVGLFCILSNTIQAGSQIANQNNTINIVNNAQLSRLQYTSIEQARVLNSSPNEKEGSSLPLKTILWEKTANGTYRVPYDLTDYPWPRVIEMMDWCFTYISRGSNIRFTQRTPADKDYIQIVDWKTCLSELGRTGGVQYLSVTMGCDSRYNVCHEILHALGIEHQINRPDRDDYIDVNLTMVNENAQQKLQKFLRTSMKTDYDVVSLMHDGSIINPSRTGLLPFPIKPKDLSLVKIVKYRRSFLSSCDWNLLNTLYPGTIKPPRCKPNLVIDQLYPSQSFINIKGVKEANWLCRYGNAFHFDSGDCLLRNHQKFPTVSEEFLETEVRKNNFMINTTSLTTSSTQYI